MVKKEFIQIKIEDLIPYGNNPRHNEEAVPDVAESIRQCGDLDPIEVDENNVILSGHTRLLALRQQGFTETDVIRYTGLTEEQKKKYRLLANKTGEKATWDLEKLAEELDDLDFDGFDFGFDLDLENIEEEPEVYDDDYDPKPPEDPKSKRGDIYKLGRHRLMCGDSTSVTDVEALCGGRKIDLLLTDPPYNVNYEGGTGMKIQNDNMEDEQFRQFLRDAFLTADTVMKPGATFYIWHADSEGYNFRGACHDIGWNVRQCLIWVKNSLVLGRQDYQWKHEPCLYGWKDGASHNWYNDRKQTTVLEFDRPSRSAEHPTMKPVPLFDYQIKNSSKKGDAVLDLFGGSGTTIVCCEQNGRDAYLMELDPKYVDVIIDRYEKLTGDKAVLLTKEDRMPLSHDWKPINGFEGYYVSKSGDVFSRKRNVVLKHSIHRGYHAVKLYVNGKGKSKFVHRLVAEAFIENPNIFPEVNHKDENTSNNAADNLEWCTSKYNANYGTLPERQRKRMLANNPFKGMHHTKETKAKMRAAKLGKPSLRKREVCIDGVIYESVADAMRELNVCTRKLYKLLEVN